MPFKHLSLTLCLATCAATHLAASTVSATFLSANGQKDSSGNLISPYAGTINGVAATFYCDDFANEVSNNQSWTANLTNLGAVSQGTQTLSNTRYGGITQTLATSTGTASFSGLQLYSMAAWLSTQFTPNGASNGDVQDTIWDLFNPNSSDTGIQPPKPSSNAWLFAAEQNYSKVGLSNFSVLTNVSPQMTGKDQVQEFLVAPEPSSIFLVVAGMAILVFRLRRKQAA